MNRSHLVYCLLLTCASMTWGCTSLQQQMIPGISKSSVKASEHTEELEAVEVKDPAKVQLAYARWQEHIGNLAEAQKSYERTLHNNPQSAHALVGLARIDHLAGRNDVADQGFAKAMEIAPNDAHVLDAVGQFYVAEQRYVEGIELLKRAIAAAPHESAIRYHLAVALAQSGDVNAALAHFESTVGVAEACYNVGLILYNAGDVAQAEHYFQRAIDQKPELKVARYWLDKIHGAEKSHVQLVSGESDAVHDMGDLALPAVPAPEHVMTADVVAPMLHAPAVPGSAIQSAAVAVPQRQMPPMPPLPSSVLASPTPSPSSPTPGNTAQSFSGLPLTGVPTMTPQQKEQWENQSSQL